jgi:hypothetical protein
VPIDNLIATWTEATLPANWQQIRARWSAFHTVRTFLSLGAVAAAVGAGLTTHTAAHQGALQPVDSVIDPPEANHIRYRVRR